MPHATCNACGWSQDAFWDMHGYTPFRWLLNWEQLLFGPDLDALYSEASYTTRREFLAQQAELAAYKIRNMVWRRPSEVPPDAECPKCHKQTVQIFD